VLWLESTGLKYEFTGFKHRFKQKDTMVQCVLFRVGCATAVAKRESPDCRADCLSWLSAKHVNDNYKGPKSVYVVALNNMPNCALALVLQGKAAAGLQPCYCWQ
jgi:hypothetical protein